MKSTKPLKVNRGPWRLEVGHQEDTNGQGRDEPSEIDAIHPNAS